MSSLFKRSNGVYYVAFHSATQTPNRVHVSTRTRIKREADSAQRRLDTAYHGGTFDPWHDDARAVLFKGAVGEVPTKVEPLTLGTAARRFLASRANLRPTTRERYDSIITRFARHAGCDRAVTAMGTPDVQAFIDSTPTKPVTAHNYRRAISTFFRWLEAEGVCTGDPTKRVRLGQVPAKHPRYLTPADLEAICEAVEAQDAKPHVETGTGRWLLPIVRVNVYLGLRAGELVNLRWADVDFDRGTLTVRCTEDFTTKAGKDRTIPLAAPAQLVLCSLPRRGEFVFPNHSGTQLHRKYLSRRFKHFARLANLPEFVNFHTTRHTAASWLAERGASIEAIRLFLGHSSVSVTQRYMHLAPNAYASQIYAAFSQV